MTMTVAEAKAAGLLDAPKGKRTTRKAEPRNGSLSRCLTHGGEFTGDAAETRHVNEHHGCRIEFPC